MTKPGAVSYYNGVFYEGAHDDPRSGFDFTHNLYTPYLSHRHK